MKKILSLYIILISFLYSMSGEARSNDQIDYFKVQYENGKYLRYKRIENGYILLLTPGQKIKKSLSEFQRILKIKTAYVTGVGAVRNTTIGYFNFNSNRHDETLFKESNELVNLNCNLTQALNKQKTLSPVSHCHLSIGLSKKYGHKVVGGHLVEAEISVIGEIFVYESGVEVLRGDDRPFNGKLIKLNDLSKVKRKDLIDKIQPKKPSSLGEKHE